MRSFYSIFAVLLIGIVGIIQISYAERYYYEMEPTLSCQPNVTYVHDLMICMCTEEGNWPNKICSAQFSVLYEKNLVQQCNPDSYVRVHCNVCKCNKQGLVDYNKCTRHPCETKSEPVKSRKSTESVTGKCSPNIWYSFAPCQLCFCVNETKLVCSPSKNDLDTITFGKYSFTVCGKMFLKDTIELMPNPEKILRLDVKKDNSDAEDTNNDREITESEENQKYVNRKGKTPQSTPNTVEKSSVESDSDDDDDEEPNKVTAITAMPFQDKPVNEEVKQEELANVDLQEDSYSDETPKIQVKPSVFFPDELEDDDGTHNILRNQNTADEEDKSNLGVSVSKVLKKVLNFASRKDHFRKMVSLDSKGTCVPGTKTAVACNTCFCMRNGKMLCTMKLCKD